MPDGRGRGPAPRRPPLRSLRRGAGSLAERRCRLPLEGRCGCQSRPRPPLSPTGRGQGEGVRRKREFAAAEPPHLNPLPGGERRQDCAGSDAHGFFPRGFLLTSCSAFLARGLRASLVAWTSPGLPAPVSDGLSVVLGVCAGVFGFTLDGAFG